ncbi:MAG: hypothetical protein JST70_16990 [Bacteroidetes bacterium]|nr:hypothetical protein [Bacteroidota bacterium]
MMRKVGLICTTILLMALKALAVDDAKTDRILIILDVSSFMQYQWKDSLTKYQSATKFILQLMDSVYARNNTVEFGLRAYGERSFDFSNDCYASKQEVMFSGNNYTQMSLRLASLASGNTAPLRFAISEALKYELPQGQYNYHLVILTSGTLTCDSSLCDLTPLFKTSEATSICLLNFSNEKSSILDCIGAPQQLPQNSQYGKFINDMLNGCCPINQQMKTSNLQTSITPHNKEDHTFPRILKKQGESGLTQVKSKTTLTVQKMPDPLPVIQLPAQPADNGFGYLKIKELSDIVRIKLYYFENGQFILLDRIAVDNLYKEQSVKLQAGKYKIRYDVKLTAPLTREKNETFTIVKGMITDIRLN